MGRARTTVLVTTIAAFSVAALLGVLALLGGSFGTTALRILGTTALVGCASVAVLCYLAVGGTGRDAVGVVGGVAAAGTVVLGLAVIWADEPGEALVRGFVIGIIVAASLAQASLLLALTAHRARHHVNLLLLPTLVLVTVLAGLLIVSVFESTDDLGRAIGVTAILDVLGTVVVAALSRLGQQEDSAAAVTVTLTAPLAERIERVGGGRGYDAVVDEALEDWLRSHGG